MRVVQNEPVVGIVHSVEREKIATTVIQIKSKKESAQTGRRTKG